MIDTNKIFSVLIQEFNVSCDMIKLAIENMDETKWYERHNNWSYNHTLYHILESIEFYSYDDPKGMETKGTMGISSENLTKEELDKLIDGKPKDFFFSYLAKVRKLITDKLSSFTVDELFAKDSFAEWGFTSRFHKFSYVLRHTMMHTGELNKTLRDLQLTRIKWL